MPDRQLIQEIIDSVVAQMNTSHIFPIKRIVWIPPTDVTQDPIGTLAIEYWK